MAINYLNSIDLNRNELQDAQLIRAQVENQPNDAAVNAGGTPVAGQIYYNTTDNVLKQYNGTAWTSIAGDITSIAEGTYINIDNADGPIPTINHDLTSRTDTASTDTPAYGGTFDAVTSVTTNSTGHITAIDVSTVTIPASDNTNTTYTLGVDAGGANDVDLVLTAGGSGSGTQTVTIEGETNQINIDNTGDTVEVELSSTLVTPGTLTVSGDFQTNSDVQFTGTIFDVGSNTSIDFGSNRITEVADPTADQDVATKAYVDSTNVGQLIYQGGYNASTNTPDLDVSPSASIKTGFTYTVTVDGLFFTEQVRVGDVIIAETDAPTTLADWTTVQNNVDLADASTVGIGNVAPGDAIDVSYSNGTATISVEDSTTSVPGALTVSASSGTFYDGLIVESYSNGIAVLGLNVDGLPNVNTTSTSSKVAVYDEATDRNKSMELDNFFKLASGSISKTGTITAGNLSGTVTHAFGINTIVQTIDSSGNTVYCDITRTATTAVATISAVEATDITILVQKIG